MIHSATFGKSAAWQHPVAPSGQQNPKLSLAPPLFGQKSHVHGSQCSHNHIKKDKVSSPDETKGFFQHIGGWFQGAWKAIKKNLNAFTQWLQKRWASKTPKKVASQQNTETTLPKPQKTTHHHHGGRCSGHHHHSHH